MRAQDPALLGKIHADLRYDLCCGTPPSEGSPPARAQHIIGGWLVLLPLLEHTFKPRQLSGLKTVRRRKQTLLLDAADTAELNPDLKGNLPIYFCRILLLLVFPCHKCPKKSENPTRLSLCGELWIRQRLGSQSI